MPVSEQGRFKCEVSRHGRACRVTSVRNPIQLVASRIKSWRECDNAERLHPGNGLLLTPTIGCLLEHRFISLCEEGNLIVSPAADGDSLGHMSVLTDPWIFVESFSSDERYFLAYHCRHILLRSGA